MTKISEQSKILHSSFIYVVSNFNNLTVNQNQVSEKHKTSLYKLCH